MKEALQLNRLDETHERDAVLIVGAGQNTAHMEEALKGLGEKHPVYVAEVAPPQIEVDPENLFYVNTPEGLLALEERIKLGMRAVYLSLVPAIHEEYLTKYVNHAAEGEVGIVVTAKPAVTSREELRNIDAALKAAHAKRRERYGDDYKPEENPILYVHEHYKTKGAWNTLVEQFGEVTDRLGVLRSAMVDIEEARTAEEEGRTKAFAGGAMEDLGPHVISLGLDVQSAVNNNTNGKYTIIDRSETKVDRFRYEDSELPDGVETSFIIHGGTEIRDNESGQSHGLNFVWRGGKGLVDKKEAVLTFVHPVTNEVSVITVDLKNNRLDLPEAVADLFPETQFTDNGYGASVEMGLNGGDPNRSFQSWNDARKVTIWGDNLSRKARMQGDPTVHRRGTSLEELTSVAA